jgi:hypothetical protein
MSQLLVLRRDGDNSGRSKVFYSSQRIGIRDAKSAVPYPLPRPQSPAPRSSPSCLASKRTISIDAVTRLPDVFGCRRSEALAPHCRRVNLSTVCWLQKAGGSRFSARVVALGVRTLVNGKNSLGRGVRGGSITWLAAVSRLDSPLVAFPSSR